MTERLNYHVLGASLGTVSVDAKNICHSMGALNSGVITVIL